MARTARTPTCTWTWTLDCQVGQKASGKGEVRSAGRLQGLYKCAARMCTRCALVRCACVAALLRLAHLHATFRCARVRQSIKTTAPRNSRNSPASRATQLMRCNIQAPSVVQSSGQQWQAQIPTRAANDTWQRGGLQGPGHNTDDSHRMKSMNVGWAPHKAITCAPSTTSITVPSRSKAQHVSAGNMMQHALARLTTITMLLHIDMRQQSAHGPNYITHMCCCGKANCWQCIIQ